ncbi:MAG TPA: DUF4389 domain-containing protein [Terriglobia bacterium]|nr:DUF4389 domain-containing protein [Terriglobia bacterium]
MYPVSIDVEPALENRNRLTTAFRLILAVPHLILVGGLYAGFAFNNDGRRAIETEGGLIGAATFFLAIVSWFTILFGNVHLEGIRSFTAFYLRWRVRAIAYFMLLRDEYPPFGDGPYPASITIAPPSEPRDRLSVGLRIIYAIPHFIALFFILLAWTVTTVIAWFAILFTAAYPASLYRFGVGAMTWWLRVEAYVLLMVDEYPPFALT